MLGRRTAWAIALLLLPVGTVTGAALHDATGVEQHTTYVEIRLTIDPGPDDVQVMETTVDCRTGSAMERAITWTKTRGEATCVPSGTMAVYAYADDAPDPRSNPTLTPTDRAYLVEGDEESWQVREYAYRTATGQTHYTWITQMSANSDDETTTLPVVTNTSRMPDANGDVAVSTGPAPSTTAEAPTFVTHLDISTDRGLSA